MPRRAAPAVAAPVVARVPWADHVAYMRSAWTLDRTHTGHVSIIAKNGDGKTVLWRELMAIHETPTQRIGVIDFKGDDPELQIFRRVSRIPSPRARALQRMVSVRQKEPEHYRLIVDPRRDVARVQVAAALNDMYGEGGWLVPIDELKAVTESRAPNLGLVGPVDNIYLRGRSRGVALIACTQAPRFAPSSFYDQCAFLYVSKLLDLRARKRLAEVGGDTVAILATLDTLQQHEYLCVAEGGRRMEIVRVPWPPPSRRRA